MPSEKRRWWILRRYGWIVVVFAVGLITMPLMPEGWRIVVGMILGGIYAALFYSTLRTNGKRDWPPTD